MNHYTLTFFAAAKKDKQRKRLEAPAKWAPWSARGSGASGICVRAPARACDKGVILPAALRAPKSTSKTTRYVLALTPRYRTVARHCTTITIATATATATATTAVIVIEIGTVIQHTDISLRQGSRGSAGTPRRGEADGPTNQNRSPWFPLQTRPRRT